jgi:hypothetical protein
MASVMLQPVVVPSLPSSTDALAGSTNQLPPTPVVQTLMDGSFTIPNVKPGDYYAIAELDGYVSALSLLSQEDLGHPTESMLQTMASLVKPVTVSLNSSSRADITLVKGGSISGVVRFEDGSPDVNSRVVLKRQYIGHGLRNYYTTTLTSPTVNTDDQGHFRFAGLPEGDYTVLAILSVKNMIGTDVSKWHGGSNLSAASTSTLSVYYGDTFRVTPKRIPLKAAGNSVGDIQIQLSKLHSISGTVVDATNGAPVNSGTVTIVWPKGGDFGSDAQVTTTNIDDDGSFHFAFIPEGQFTLSATNLREMTQKPMTGFIRNESGAAGQYRASIIMREPEQMYGDAQIPLIVQSDMTGVTVSAPPKATSKTTASSQ